jgi:acetoin utilization deacetylase AcuC-like enzyme
MNSQDKINSSNAFGFLLDNRYLLHNPGNEHPESPERLTAVRQALEPFAASNHWRCVQPRKANNQELQLVHDPIHIERIEQAAKCAPYSLDPDTSVSIESYETARLAAGGVLQCIDSICVGKLRRAFAFVRPPGHHASRDNARGFCLFNNVAVAAAYARSLYKFERIAIVDFDVHHGNGTQSCFYSDPSVLYISTHQYPFYPGSGYFNEVGRGAGKGYSLNFPLPEGSGDSNFVPIYSKIVPTILAQYSPQLIIVSAGFDGHFRDSLGGLLLTHSGYAAAAASLIAAAENLCDGRICFVLEGGYSPQGLRDSIGAIMTEMEKRAPREASIHEGAIFQEISRQAAKFTAGLWKW